MKIYNHNIGKIETIPVTILIEDVNRFTSKMTEEQLNAEGYYYIVYENDSKTLRRYYDSTSTSSLVENKWVVSSVGVDKDVEQVKSNLLTSISDTFKTKSVRPQVDTGLGYFVDGGRTDVQNFETGKKFSLPQVKDVDGNFHNVSTEDYDTIIAAIETNGLALYQTKWLKEAEVNNLVDVDACILYERTPNGTETVLQWEDTEQTIPLLDENGDQVSEEIQLYKNNCTEW